LIDNEIIDYHSSIILKSIKDVDIFRMKFKCITELSQLVLKY